MKAEQLKKSIIQLAISGKLIKQSPFDEPASILLQKIKAAKQELIKQGKLKKEKALPPIADEEKPFDIPENWEWVRLGNFCLDIFSGKSPKYVKTANKNIIIGQQSNQDYGIDFSYAKFCENKFIESMNEKFFLRDYDVILNTLGNGTLGRAGIFLGEHKKVLTDGHLFVFRTLKSYSSKFLYYYFKLNRREIEKSANGTTNQIFLSLTKTATQIIPLPPLAEQQRIVDKIERILPLIDKYDLYEKELSELEDNLQENLKKSILQYAIQGKLVSQISSDEPASILLEKIHAERQELIKQGKIKKEKPLFPIADGEKPFDIPASWQWVRLGELATKLTDGTHSTPRYTEQGVPFLSVKDMSKGYLDFSSCRKISQSDHEDLFKRCNPEKGDLLITKVGTTGIPIIVKTDKQFSLFVSVALLKFDKTRMNLEFLKYAIMSPLVQKMVDEKTKGVGNQNWVLRDIANTIMPIPPLLEQQRIVAKIEMLFSIVNNIYNNKKNFTSKILSFSQLKQENRKETIAIAAQGDDKGMSELLED